MRFALALFLVACGASPARVHATTADTVMAVIDSGGVAISRACELELDRCASSACVDDVEQRCVAAAAARDALIDPAHAYRDAVLRGDAEPYLGAVLALWPALREAYTAIHLPAPEIQ